MDIEIYHPPVNFKIFKVFCKFGTEKKFVPVQNGVKRLQDTVLPYPEWVLYNQTLEEGIAEIKRRTDMTSSKSNLQLWGVRANSPARSIEVLALNQILMKKKVWFKVAKKNRCLTLLSQFYNTELFPLAESYFYYYWRDLKNKQKISSMFKTLSYCCKKKCNSKTEQKNAMQYV